jgi:hypothetical protein
MVGSLGVIVDEEFGESFMEKRLVMDDVEVAADEFFLKGSVIAFDEGVDFGAAGIREKVRDAIRMKLLIEVA